MSGRVGIRICNTCVGVNIALVVVHLVLGNRGMAAMSVVSAVAAALLGSLWRRKLGAAR